ncbi:heavy metal translocating P-type ATPase [Psychrilyobacter sp.]|uniref:heavy metal translocating P-type ATPase n=1 Tax=Psychrilyobacter sp. TaxID=2586924 RepID=UPI003015D14F
MKKNKLPLMKCFEEHYTKGRLRVKIRALKYLTKYNEELTTQLLMNKSIKDLKISNITHNVLIYFDEEKLSKENLLELIENIISNYSLPAYRDERSQERSLDIVDRSLYEKDTTEIMKNIVISAAILLYFIWSKVPTPLNFYARLINKRSLVVLSLAMPVIKNGMKSLVINKKPTANTLSASAIIGSILLGKEKSALSIIILEDLAELITAYTLKKTRNAIKDILSTGEEFVWKQLGQNQMKKVPIAEVEEGDIIVVHPGEKISVDGEVIKGEALVDQASITGEFMPVTKEIGSEVFAGTVVKTGTFNIRSVKVGDSTAVSRIIKLVEDASYNKAAIQTYADNFSNKIVGLNFLLASLVFIGTKSFSRALSMLVVDYSCCIKLSTAVAFSAAINKAAENGILVKGSNYIEALSKIDTVIFDKTGTLTEGNPKLVTVEVLDKTMDVQKVIELAGAAEETSNHPLAQAILKDIATNGYEIPEHEQCEITVSRGVTTKVGNSLIIVGNRKIMLENNVILGNEKEITKAMMYRGEAIIYVAKDKNLIGLLGITDPLRENMKKTINRLRFQGVDNIILLTGDLDQQAEIVANRMTLDSYESELMPEDKAKNILRLQSKGESVLMVGDGVNDAPALAYADVGLAIGNKRTDVAIEAADVSIARNDPTLIPATINLSKKTMSTIKENFIISIGVNTLALVLGAAGVLPVVQGSLIHNLSTLVVVGNSLKILGVSMKK